MEGIIDWCGYRVPLLELNQGLVRESDKPTVAEPLHLCFEFGPNAIVVEASLHEHIHVLNVAVPARVHLEQEYIFVARQPNRQRICGKERFATLAHPVGQHLLLRNLLVEDVEATPSPARLFVSRIRMVATINSLESELVNNASRICE